MQADEDGAAGRLWSMANLGTPMAIRVAATLRIADHLAEGPRTAPELAAATGVNADALDRLLRYLSVRGVLHRDDHGHYSLTDLGQPLRDEHSAGLRAWFDIEGVGRGELSFVELLHSVRTGEAAYPERYGRPYWEDMAADPARIASFNALLGADVSERAPGILAGYDWGPLGQVIDVGGGDGSLLIALLTANPSLRGTVVDLPDAVSSAKEAFTEAGLGHRADAVAGSFFDRLPEGGDAYILSLVLHDWDDTSAVEILRRCRDAAGSTGSVLVIESVEEGETRHTGMDMRMLCIYGARERGVAEFSGLATEAGLELAGVHRAGASAIIELKAATR